MIRARCTCQICQPTMGDEPAMRYKPHPARRIARPQVDYDEYLASPGWKQKRDLVLWRDNFLCRGCLSARATEVHHMTYENVGDEFAFQLVSLCRACHARNHGRSGAE